MEFDDMAMDGPYDDHEQYTNPICSTLFKTDLRNIFLSILRSGELDVNLVDILRMTKIEVIWTFSNIAYSSNAAQNLLIYDSPVMMDEKDMHIEQNHLEQSHNFFELFKQLIDVNPTDYQMID